MLVLVFWEVFHERWKGRCLKFRKQQYIITKPIETPKNPKAPRCFSSNLCYMMLRCCLFGSRTRLAVLWLLLFQQLSLPSQRWARAELSGQLLCSLSAECQKLRSDPFCIMFQETAEICCIFRKVKSQNPKLTNFFRVKVEARDVLVVDERDLASWVQKIHLFHTAAHVLRMFFEALATA